LIDGGGGTYISFHVFLRGEAGIFSGDTQMAGGDSRRLNRAAQTLRGSPFNDNQTNYEKVSLRGTWTEFLQVNFKMIKFFGRDYCTVL
jgi:hypothetical protein